MALPLHRVLVSEPDFGMFPNPFNGENMEIPKNEKIMDLKWIGGSRKMENTVIYSHIIDVGSIKNGKFNFKMDMFILKWIFPF